MAIDIGVGDGRAPHPAQGEPSLALQDDGYYWFLHPLFERLAAETGQYVDLYGEATFAGERLDALERMIMDARRLARSQPGEWLVQVGVQIAPERCDLYRPVERRALLALLGRWAEVVERARQSGRPVVCLGD